MSDASGFDWNQARAFLATVEAGSLSKAARGLGLTQPTLSRQVAALEEGLGVVLFERVGRSLVLTPTGRDLLDHFRDMGTSAGRIALAASGHSQAVEGLVSITASDALSAFVLPPLLKQLRVLAPGIEIEVIAANDLRDLQRREADIAIRHVRPVQPELIGRQVAVWSAHLYAARGFLEEHGRPLVPTDLTALDFIGFAPIERLVQTMVSFGLPVSRRNFRYVTDNGIVLAEMLRLGLGMTVTPKEFARFVPDLEMVLPDWQGIPVPLWLICHRELLTSRRIRIVYDFLAEALSGGG
jgi:DNA-binding transcriptional LysR family regulator